MRAQGFTGIPDGRVFYFDGEIEREVSPSNQFEWWRQGAEQCDLAATILQIVGGSFRSTRYASRFAAEVIDTLSEVGFDLPSDAVRLWMSEAARNVRP